MKSISKLPEYDRKSIYPNKKVLSSSQVLLYEKDPASFYTCYELGAVGEKSIPMLVGSVFAALHEMRNFDHRAVLAEIGAPKHIPDLFERVIKHFPVVPAEQALLAPLGKWKIRVTLDGLLLDQWTIIENKTGEKQWNKERVNFDDQLTIQAWAFWKVHGVIPKQILLNWVNTKKNCTKELHTFKTTRSVKAVKMFERRIEAVIAGIEAQNWTQPLYETYY